MNKFSLKKEINKQENEKRVLAHAREKMEKARTMKLSIKEGASCSVMSGLGDSYITPFALALKASDFQIGLLSSLTSLFPPLAQIFGSKLIEKYSRKKIIVKAVALQALMWIPLALLAISLWKNIFTSNLPIILITFYTLYAVFGAVATPAWFSMMGDIVPDKHRGIYFGTRNKITGAVALIATLIGAFILDYFKTRGLVLIGFSILFFAASLFRLYSAYLFSKHHEPKFEFKKKDDFSFIDFVKLAPYTNFGRFFFVAFVNFAVMIASPFFSVYMLQELHYSYITFMIVNISSSVLLYYLCLSGAS